MIRQGRIRIASVSIAVVAFFLALVTGDLFFIATSAFVLVAAVVGAVIAGWQEQRNAR